MPGLILETPDATARLAARIAPHLRAGDVIGLHGDLGAGKSHFCRALISARLGALGRTETHIPSPSYTLVQSYDLDEVELSHVDLYRLGDPSELAELGLDEAFGTAICLVEWADRLGGMSPHRRLDLRLDFMAGQDCARHARFEAHGLGWAWLADACRADIVAAP